MAVNVILSVVKIAAGIIGNSVALIADGIESTADVLCSLVVYHGLRISSRPPDANHPYGHGKAESLAAVIVALFLLGAALLIAVTSIHEILHPTGAPEPFTLVVLLGVILLKTILYRVAMKTGEDLGSTSLKGDAWHHQSDAITSLIAFVGISVALIGGDRYASADAYAALAACLVIAWNGVRVLRPALDEVMDAAAPDHVDAEVRRIAESVPDVLHVEKCRIRKSGLGLLMDLHVNVDGALSVARGHEIAHEVKDRLMESCMPVHDVIVHIEPAPPAI